MAATMEKPKARKAKAEPTDLVKVPLDAAEKARIVAALSKRSMVDIFGEILRPALAKMELELIAEKAQQLGVGGDAKARKGGA